VSGVPRSVRVSRVIRAPADQLFRAWTDPQELQHWWRLDENGWECVEAIVVPPESLRALLVAEAELGERILRALILRRLALIELGFGGPVLVGTLKSPDVTRLSHLLERNAIPFRVVDPDEDQDGAALLARFAPTSDELPIAVLTDGAQPTHRGRGTARDLPLVPLHRR
jgi:thioredoxin reductase (NADPH)